MLWRMVSAIERPVFLAAWRISLRRSFGIAGGKVSLFMDESYIRWRTTVKNDERTDKVSTMFTRGEILFLARAPYLPMLARLVTVRPGGQAIFHLVGNSGLRAFNHFMRKKTSATNRFGHNRNGRGARGFPLWRPSDANAGRR